MKNKIIPGICGVLAIAVIVLGIMLSGQKNDNAALSEQVAALTGDVDAKTAEIAALTGDVDAKAAEIAALTGDVDAKAAEIEALTGDVDAKAAEIAALTGDVAAKASEIETLTGDAAARDAQIAELEERITGLTGQLAEAEAATSTAILSDTMADDVTCKGTYTAYEAKAVRARGATAAVLGDTTLTNGVLQIFYKNQVENFFNTYGAYASYLGLDATLPLDAQMFYDGSMTWQQYFLREALNSWNSMAALAEEADARGLSLSDESRASLEQLPATLAEKAVSAGYETADDMIAASLGTGVTLADYMAYVEMYYKAGTASAAIEAAAQPDEAQIEAWFAAHEEEYAAAGLTRSTCVVDVRHILIMPEGADSSTVRTQEWSEEVWDAAKTAAEELLKQWTEGGATEESFAALADANSQDAGSNSNGGLYSGVTEGQMVQAFNDWCFDAARQPGDTGIVKTEYGYHVMYFSGSHTTWQAQAETDCLQSALNAEMTRILEARPIEISWANILLTNLPLS